jgi:YVTN family beta-propeller protein
MQICSGKLPDFRRNMTTRRSLLAGSAAMLACGRRRPTAFPGYVFVANQGERSVAAVDLTKFSVERQIRLDAAPSVLMADSERHSVYALTLQEGRVFAIAASDLSVKRKLSLGGPAIAMRLAPDGGSLWVLCQSPHALVRVALDRFESASRLSLPATPEAFDLSHDGALAAVTFLETQSVAFIDLAKPAVTNVVPAGQDPRAVLFRSPDGRQIMVGNRSARMLSILDVKTGVTLVRLPLPIEPEHFCVKADGGQVFITGKGMDAVVVVHPYQTEVAETVLAGKAPGAMAISPDYLFAANPESGDVTVLEVRTRNAIAAIAVGREPCFITFTPDYQYALVVNHRSGDLAVIRLRALTELQPRTKTAPLFTMIPVGSEPVSAAVAAV